MNQNGYAGKLLKINLSDSKISMEDTPVDFIENIGGICYGAKVLYETTEKGLDPLSPKSPLMFLTGPITGTEVLMSGRHAVVAKSPLTGIFGYAMCGGFFGYRLKRCGFDGIIFYGKASSPKSLLLSEDKAELIEASNWWGKNNREIRKIITKKYPKSPYLSIGIAGENQVPISDNQETVQVGTCILMTYPVNQLIPWFGIDLLFFRCRSWPFFSGIWGLAEKWC